MKSSPTPNIPKPNTDMGIESFIAHSELVGAMNKLYIKMNSLLIQRKIIL